MRKILTHPATLFSLYIALIGGSYLPYFAFLPIRISYHVVVTAVLIWWIWRDGFPSTPLLWPLAGMAAVSFMSALTSIDPRIALEAWWHWLVNGLLGLMLIHWMRKGWSEKLFKAHFAIAGVIVLVSILQAVAEPGSRANMPFGLINLTGAYAAVLIVPALAWGLAERRAWLLALAGGLVMVLVLNDSRGAFISAGVAGVALLLLTYRVKWPVALATVAIVGALAFGVMQKSLTPGHANGDAYRQDIWRSALAMFADRPLTGVGPGLFGQAFRQYRTIPADNMSGAHSWYFNLLAENGLTGGVAAAAAGVVFLRALPKRRSIKHNAVLAALAGVATHLLFDNFPANNFVFLINLYVAYLVAGKETRRPTLKSVTLEAASATLLIFFALFFALFDTAQVYYEQSLRFEDTGAARAAAVMDAGNRLYQINLARLEGDAGRVLALDPTIDEHTRMDVYGLISYGRFLP